MSGAARPVIAGRQRQVWATIAGQPRHSHVITIRGDSYRLREKRRAGLIKAPLHQEHIA
jgi:hypothetical protein